MTKGIDGQLTTRTKTDSIGVTQRSKESLTKWLFPKNKQNIIDVLPAHTSWNTHRVLLSCATGTLDSMGGGGIHSMPMNYLHVSLGLHLDVLQQPAQFGGKRNAETGVGAAGVLADSQPHHRWVRLHARAALECSIRHERVVAARPLHSSPGVKNNTSQSIIEWRPFKSSKYSKDPC